MKQVTLDKIRKMAKRSVSKSKAPRCLVETRIQFIMWSIKQKLTKTLTTSD